MSLCKTLYSTAAILAITLGVAVLPASRASLAAAPAAGATNEHGLATVTNPYLKDAKAIDEGKNLFVSYACSGCHGAGGGGGMCPPVINDVWVYGNDETTLFNLVKLGSTALQGKGYTRIGTEKIVGDMPAFEGMLTDDQIYKLLAFVHSRYAGDAASP